MKLKLVGTSPARVELLRFVHDEEERRRNIFGLVLTEDNIPVRCGHGGSGLLCAGCGLAMLKGEPVPKLKFKRPDNYGLAKSFKTNIDVIVEQGIAEYVDA